VLARAFDVPALGLMALAPGLDLSNHGAPGADHVGTVELTGSERLPVTASARVGAGAAPALVLRAGTGGAVEGEPLLHAYAGAAASATAAASAAKPVRSGAAWRAAASVAGLAAKQTQRQLRARCGATLRETGGAAGPMRPKGAPDGLGACAVAVQRTRCGACGKHRAAAAARVSTQLHPKTRAARTAAGRTQGWRRRTDIRRERVS
jgi:hypothetical protein